MPPPPPPCLRSFWMGGFEGADHRNGQGQPLDMVEVTDHQAQLENDYARCARHGLRSVRESIGWRLAEPSPGRYDFARLHHMARAAERQGVQVLWTLMHYGMPDDLHVLHADFVPRFAAFAAAVAAELKPLHTDALPPIVTPINEIGFVAWVLSETDNMAGGPPGERHLADFEIASSTHSGYALKRRLVQASLAAMKAMREVDPRIRFLQIEPVVHVVAPPGRPELQPLADEVASFQWQVWDLLCGRMDPELGGTPDGLDLLGINHYHSGQWEVLTEKRLLWHLDDPRRKPFSRLLTAAWRRYERPLLVAETSHVGAGRAQWLDEVAADVERVRAAGVPLHGICLYPIVDRPDWDRLEHWHRSGLWDAAATEFGKPDNGPPGRVLCRPYARALGRWQQRLPVARPPASTATGKPTMSTPLIVFSHLRWDFVFQRPQHLLSRLARQHPVFFFEEPVHTDGPARLEQIPAGDGVTVLRPHTAAPGGGYDDEQLPVLATLLEQWLADEGPEDYLAWFYTPLALPLLDGLAPQAVIYDCMDELAAFKHAPRQLKQRETTLLKRADIVLTGGPSLYEAKRDIGRNVHCLPSSVDAAHYAPERVTRDCEHYLAAEKLQGHLIAPRLGFFGVIDERLDIGLLAGVADAHPDWQLVMVGPVVKIDPAHLPQRPNLHWLGQQSYQRLPALVAGWDVCLLPFALNEHTRFISPTKTLEYLAAEKPVVSTPVKDVVTLYGESVRVAEGLDAFVAACEAALAETPDQRKDRLRTGAASVARYSWDAAARKVLSLIDEVLAQRAALLSEHAAEDDALTEPMDMDTYPMPLQPVAAVADGARLKVLPAVAR